MKGAMKILEKAATVSGAALSVAKNRPSELPVTVMLVTREGLAWMGSGETLDEAALEVIVRMLAEGEEHDRGGDPMAEAGLL